MSQSKITDFSKTFINGSTITINQIFDLKKLKYIQNNLKCLFNSINEPLKEIDHTNLKKKINLMIKLYNLDGLKVDYKQAYYNYGRLFADKNLSIGNLNKCIKHSIISEYVSDIDFVNSQPTIFSQLCKKNNIECPNLDNYIFNRDKLLNSLAKTHKINKIKAKELLLTILFGNNQKLKTNLKWLSDFKDEIVLIRNEIIKIHPDVHDIAAEKCKKNNNDNIKGCALSLILGEIEKKCLLSQVKFLTSNGYTVRDLSHDGAYYDKDNFTDELLNSTMQFIENETGYKMTLKEKPLDEYFNISEEDLENFIYKEDIEDVSYEIVLEEFEKTTFKINNPIFFCYKTEDNDFLPMTRTDLTTKHENLFFDKFNNKLKMMVKEPFINTWLKDPNMKTYEKMDFIPPPLKAKDNILNLWAGFLIDNETSNNNIKPFLDHIDVMTNNDKTASKYLIEWIAHIIQEPANINGVAIVLKGDEGTGKNTLFYMIRSIIGKSLCHETNDPARDLLEKFGEGRKNKLLISINDYNVSEVNKNADRIKSVITDDTFIYERKGVTPITLRNCNRFIFTSNKDIPITIGNTDRRYCVLETSNKYCGNKIYFDAIYKYMNDKQSMKAVYDYLLKVDLININWIKDRPLTEAYKEIKERYCPLEYRFLMEKVIDGEKENTITYNKTELQKTFKNYIDENNYKYETNPINFGCKMKKIDGFTIPQDRNNRSYNINIEKVKAFLIKQGLEDPDIKQTIDFIEDINIIIPIYDIMKDDSLTCKTNKYNGLLIRDVYIKDAEWIKNFEYNNHINLTEKQIKVNELITLLN